MIDCTFTAAAVRDYFAAVRFYARLRPKEGRRFVRMFEYTIRRIVDTRPRGTMTGFKCFALGMHGYPDYVLYYLDGTAPLVVGVGNMHRRPDYWKGQ